MLNRTDRRRRGAAGASKAQEVRRIPTGSAITAGGAGQPAARQAARASLMAEQAAGEGESSSSRPQMELRSRGGGAAGAPRAGGEDGGR